MDALSSGISIKYWITITRFDKGFFGSLICELTFYTLWLNITISMSRNMKELHFCSKIIVNRKPLDIEGTWLLITDFMQHSCVELLVEILSTNLFRVFSFGKIQFKEKSILICSGIFGLFYKNLFLGSVKCCILVCSLGYF